MNIRKWIRGRDRGYVIAEAAMLIPVFLFAVVLLVYIAKILDFQEIIHFEASKSLASIAWESQAGLSEISELSYSSRVNLGMRSRIDKDIRLSASVKTEDEIYIAELSYPVDLTLPFGLYDDISIRDTVVCRKWSGAPDSGEVQGFSAMENEDGENYVYIFPKYGEKYHRSDCFYMTRRDGGYSICVGASEAMAGGYSACAVCY